jgi:hypothetical protein
MDGGLILCKLKLKPDVNNLKGKIFLSYKNHLNEKFEEIY